MLKSKKDGATFHNMVKIYNFKIFNEKLFIEYVKARFEMAYSVTFQEFSLQEMF